MAVIENIREAQRQRDEADIIKKRIQGIDRDADAFTERVTQLVNRLAEKDLAVSPEEASLLLNAKLTEAREAQSRHTELQRQLDAAHIEHAAARNLDAEIGSADLDEIMALSDRIAVMYRGEIVATFEAGEVTEDELGLLMTGGGRPESRAH